MSRDPESLAWRRFVRSREREFAAAFIGNELEPWARQLMDRYSDATDLTVPFPPHKGR